MAITIVSYPERRKHIHEAWMTNRKENLLSQPMRGKAASVLHEEMTARLRAAREALGLKSGEVARRLGIPEPSYSRYETGVTPVTHKVMADLNMFFHISPSYIISGSMTDLPQHLREALDGKMREKTRGRGKQIVKKPT